MAIFEYAVSNDTNELLHVDSVKKGLECNCICPDCDDPMIAKKGKVKAHHFAHSSKTERESCYMTMLHKVMQQHFARLEFLSLPASEFSIFSKIINVPKRKVKVLGAKLEFKIGQYYADVLLETKLGDIAIEIFVTHKNEEEKINYYKNNNIASLEYDFSKYRDIPIAQVFHDLNMNVVPVNWTQYLKKEYYENKVKLEIEYQSKVSDLERKRKYLVSIDIAREKSQEIVLETKLVPPELYEDIVVNFNGGIKTVYADLLEKKEPFIFDNIITHETKMCITLSCHIKDNLLKVTIPFYGCSIPDVEDEKVSSMVLYIDYYNKNTEANLSWINYKYKKKVVDNIKARVMNALEIENILLNMVDEYIFFNKNKAYSQDYKEWLKWLDMYEITPLNQKEKMTIPKLLIVNRNFSYFWMFNSWSVFVLSVLVILIDEHPIGSEIKYNILFDALVEVLPIKKEFNEYGKFIKNSPYIEENSKKLVNKKEILSAMLNRFIEKGHLTTKRGHFINNSNLQGELRKHYR